MFSQSGYSDLPRLSSFDEARKTESRIEAIRGSGRNAGIKPLGNRKRAAIHIFEGDDSQTHFVKNPEGGVDARRDIIVQMHNTEILQYSRSAEGADKIGINLGGWDTQSTVQVLNQVLPYFLTVQIYDRRVWLKYRDAQDNRHVCTLDVNNTNWVTSQTGEYMPVSPEKNVVHRIDRKGAKQARERYKKLLDYVLSNNKIRDGEYSVEEFLDELKYDFKQPQWQYKNHYELPDESVLENISLEDLYIESLKLATLAMNHYSYFALRQTAAYGHYPRDQVHLRDVDITKALEEQIRYRHKHTMFYEEETQEMKRDPYGKYFK